MNLASICEPHPDDAVAIVSRGKPTTYGELRSQVAALRGALVESGVLPGDRVAILAANNVYFVAYYLAALGIGAIAVPLNPQSPAPALVAEVAAVGAKAILLGPGARRTFASVDRAAVPSLSVVVAPEGAGAGTLAYGDLLTHAPAPVVDRADDDLAVLIFTSGTAGSPKAAMLTHGCLRANLEQIQAQPFRAQRREDVSFGLLPFFHIFGLNVVLNLTLYVGGTVVTIERFDPEGNLETIARHGVTVVAGAPTMWGAWAQLESASPTAFRSVRVASSGAAKLPPELADAMERRFGLQVAEGYGLTEASAAVTTSIGIPAPRGSIGAPLPGIRLRLVDLDDRDVLVGDPGEILVHGPNVFAGYWNDPEATAAVLSPDGWLHTGDVAVVSDDGFLFVVDRRKDLIIVSGFNVFPAEVEQVLMDHPAVESAGVVGVAHPHTGEAVKAYVVARAGASVDEDELIAFCEDRLARYKCPHKIWFVDEIPRHSSGKVLRRELRESARADG